MAEKLNVDELNIRQLERPTRFNTKRFSKIKDKTFCRIVLTQHTKTRAFERIQEKDLSQMIAALIKRKQKNNFIVYKQKDKEKYYIKSSVNKKKVWVCGNWNKENFIVKTIFPRIKYQMKGVK
ncbi:MAG: hypothetical protein HRT99_04150 [Mycoplasmatales bacterium]|nr:hypothetical protein [Mycoplasmatales bacterium]NQZ66373.1 hypothetical protein [Mycoplasmatales bacterium]